MAESDCLLDRARGSASRMVFQEESCWGSVDDSMAPRGLDFVSETLRNPINRIESQIIRSDRMRAPPQQGNQRPAGDINGELQPNTWPILLRHALTRLEDVSVSGSGPYTHDFTGQPNMDDGLTFEKTFAFRDNDPIQLQYRGGRVNQFYWTAPLEGIIGCRAGMIFKREVLIDGDEFLSLEDSTPATYPDPNEPYNSFHAAIECNGDALVTVTTMDFLLNNNFDADGFALNGTPYRADLTEGDRGISGNMTIFFTRNSFDLFYPAYLSNETLSLRITFTRDENSLEIFLPSIKVGGDVTPAVGGKAPLNLTLTYDAFRDEAEGTDIVASVTSDDESLGTAA